MNSPSFLRLRAGASHQQPEAEASELAPPITACLLLEGILMDVQMGGAVLLPLNRPEEGALQKSHGQNLQRWLWSWLQCSEPCLPSLLKGPWPSLLTPTLKACQPWHGHRPNRSVALAKCPPSKPPTKERFPTRPYNHRMGE